MVEHRALKVLDGDLVRITKADGGTAFDEVFDNEEIAQSLTLRLTTIEGEDAWNHTLGLPVRSLIGVFDPSLIEAAVTSELLEDPRVVDVSVKAVIGDRKTRRVDVTGSVLLANGQRANLSTSVT